MTSPERLLVEAVVGALGGALVAWALPGVDVGILFFAVTGALGAPAALLLTPARGSVSARAVRYGLALAVIVTLVVSFWFGSDGISGAGLLAVAGLVFTIGVVGHAVMAAAGSGDGETSTHDG